MESMQLYPERKKRRKLSDAKILICKLRIVFTNSGQYYQRNTIGFAIVHFVSSIISCFSDLVLKSGLQSDEKRHFARMLHVNNVSRAVFKMASNYEGAQLSPDILPKFREVF